LSVEAGTTMGWAKYAHSSIGVDTFGLSGSIPDLQKHFGFTTENIMKKAQEFAGFYKDRNVESRIESAFAPSE